MLKGCGAGLRARGLVYFPARAPVPCLQSALRELPPNPLTVRVRSTRLRNTFPVLLFGQTAELFGVFLLSVYEQKLCAATHENYIKKSHHYLVITRQMLRYSV